MSLRWNSRLQAVVGDDGASVRLLRRDARGRQAIVFFHQEALETQPGDIGEAAGALDRALQAAVTGGHDIAGLRCDVAVADAWMVYDVIEFRLEDMPRHGADDLVRSVFADTTGLRADELVVRWQQHGDIRCFAGGLPMGTLRAIEAVVQKHRLRLGSINGELVLAFNENRHGLDPIRSVLAVPRKSGTQLGLILDGTFAAARFEPQVSEPGPLLESSRALMRCAGLEPDDNTHYYADETLPEEAESPWLRKIPPRPASWGLKRGGRLAALDLDLSPARPRVRPASWLMLIVGSVAVTVAAFQFQTASGRQLHEARNLEALETSLNEARGGGSAKIAPADAPVARATAAVVNELQVPWATLFTAFEAVASPQVALLSIEPSAIKHEVRLVAEAKSSAAMLDYLEGLRAQALREVVLVSHQVQAQTPGAPIRFQARAKWESQ